MAARFLSGDASRRYLCGGNGGAQRCGLGALIEGSEAHGLYLRGFLGDEPGTVQLGRRYAVSELAQLSEILLSRSLSE